jgi:hypothetical protein
MWRIFLSERDKALQLPRQSDRVRHIQMKGACIQSKQRLLQASADNQHIPLGVVESVHGFRAEKCVSKEVLAHV